MTLHEYHEGEVVWCGNPVDDRLAEGWATVVADNGFDHDADLGVMIRVHRDDEVVSAAHAQLSYRPKAHYLASITQRYGSAHAICSCGLSVDVDGTGYDQDIQVVRALVAAHEEGDR